MNFSLFLKTTFIVGIVLSLFILITPGRFTTLTIGYLLLTHIVLFILARKYSNFSVLSPFVLLYFVFYLSNLLRGLYIHSVGNIDSFKYFLVNVPYEHFEFGALLIFISSIGIFIGSSTNKLSKFRKSLPIFNYKIQTNVTSIILITIGLVILYLMLNSSSSPLDISAKRIFEMGDGESTRFGPIRFAFNILMFAIQLLFFTKLFSGKNLFKDKTMQILFAFIIIGSIVISKRSFILLTVLPVILLNLHKLNWLKSLKLITMLAVFITTIFYIGNQRSNNTTEISTSNVFLSLTNAAMLQANYGGLVSTTVSSIAIGDELDLIFGETLFLDPFLQFIPRSLYSDKPEELGGRIRIVHQQIGIAPPFIEGGIPPGIIAEAWLNGGVFFVLIYSFIIGIIMTYISVQMKLANSPTSLAILFFISETIVFFGFGGHTARIINYIITLYLGIFLMRIITRLLKPFQRN